MNRRDFLKGLFIAGSLTAVNWEIAIEQCLTETEKLTDEQFIRYITYIINLYIDNPAKCCIITNIEEP